nr:uncharacterized protein LOC109766440 [Aegilops tauschii subsp. strangulata]
MSGSGSKGNWEASCVTEKDIKELRGAGYLSADIVHGLPAKDQVLPTPKPGERVVFIPHFLRGLGFPLHPFVRGLMAAPSLFGSRPKKPKGSAAATKWDEATAKSIRFRKTVKEPQLVSAVPLSLEKSAAASIIGSAETSATTWRIDPAADLREATERNAREAREEQEAARLEKAEAEREEAAAPKKLAEAEAADFSAKKQAEEAARRQSAIFVTPLNSAPPPPEFVVQIGEAGGEHPVMERDSGDVAMPDVIVPRPPPSKEARDKKPADPPAPPAGDEMATETTPEVRTTMCHPLAKAASAPRPLETGAASSSIPDTEVTSATPTGWVRGGGTGPLNKAILDVQAKLRAEADALKHYNKAFLESREAIRDYHNLRAAAFNSKVQELDQRAIDLSESRKANTARQQQLGETNTALRAREVECGKLAEERDRLVAQLAEQTSSLVILTPPIRPLKLIAKDGGRKEAQEELVAVEDDLVKRAAAIAEYTDTSVFIPERAENGAEAPPEWVALYATL